jgi:quercetin dioxygenase-like cupin family protein
MREGEIATPGPGNTIKCIRSGQNGGPFIFELEIDPGGKGPPVHRHDEGDEIFEMVSGQLAVRVEGEVKMLGPGDTLTLRPEQFHTFWNPSKNEPSISRITHGPRFERLITQPDLTSVALYMVDVDPGASRARSSVLRALIRVIAALGRLRGKRPVMVEEATNAAP